jgi:hypothetical protein
MLSNKNLEIASVLRYTMAICLSNLFPEEALYMLKRFTNNRISKDKLNESYKGIDSWNVIGKN